jgi:RimJ/RimL family protein N-acetyltransferase
MKILETERLLLRTISIDDAEFYLRLVNEPTWLQFIGNKGVYTLENARTAILQGPVDMFERLGFCLYLVECKPDSTPIGICGLIKRDTLDDVDIGFAFLPEYCGQGYAYESAFAAMQYGKNEVGLKRLVAIVAPNNDHSIRLLEKLGMKFERMLRLKEGDAPTKLYGFNF